MIFYELKETLYLTFWVCYYVEFTILCKSLIEIVYFTV